MKQIKPPIGIMPKYLHQEQRRRELKEAIERYLDAGLVVNEDWIKEYNELTLTINNR
jgi:hypothetical protein